MFMRFALTILSALLFSFSYAQNIGIGITTPAVPLHIRNSGSELFRLQGNDPQLSFFDFSGVAKGFVRNQGDNLNLGTSVGNSGGYIQFYNNNNLNMVIHPNSNVGIGTDVPNFKLTVQTPNSSYGVIHRSNDIIVGTWIGVNGGVNGGWELQARSTAIGIDAHARFGVRPHDVEQHDSRHRVGLPSRRR